MERACAESCWSEPVGLVGRPCLEGVGGEAGEVFGRERWGQARQRDRQVGYITMERIQEHEDVLKETPGPDA